MTPRNDSEAFSGNLTTAPEPEAKPTSGLKFVSIAEAARLAREAQEARARELAAWRPRIRIVDSRKNK